ncbi:hypothetical protein AeNC1_001034 [Aphanomyces euteiches]|nr:hypothetical protein AeNC1_001034 [Aphanomyces euteiches]
MTSVPLDFFDRLPPLHEETKARLILEAQKACQETVQNAMMMDARPIETVIANPRTRRRARIRKGMDAVDPSLEGVSSYTQLKATLADVAGFFNWAAKPQQLRTFARVLGDNVLEKRTLYRLVDRPKRPGKPNPLHSISVEWAALEPPLGFAVRDMCYLECQDEFNFYDEATKKCRKGWIRTIHSTEVAGCPSLWKQYRLRRTTVHRSGHVFLEAADQPGVLDYYHVLVVGAQHRMPNVVFYRALKHHVEQALNLEEHLTIQRLIQASIVTRAPPLAASNASSCKLCDAKFGFFGARKSTCRACRQIICKACCQSWRNGELEDKVILCLVCSDKHVTGDSAQTSSQRTFSTTREDESLDAFELDISAIREDDMESAHGGTFTFLSSSRSVHHSTLSSGVNGARPTNTRLSMTHPWATSYSLKHSDSVLTSGSPPIELDSTTFRSFDLALTASKRTDVRSVGPASSYRTFDLALTASKKMDPPSYGPSRSFRSYELALTDSTAMSIPEHLVSDIGEEEDGDLDAVYAHVVDFVLYMKMRNRKR